MIITSPSALGMMMRRTLALPGTQVNDVLFKRIIKHYFNIVMMFVKKYRLFINRGDYSIDTLYIFFPCCNALDFLSIEIF